MFSQQSIWGALSDSGSKQIFWAAVNNGAPTNGTTGANICGPGSLLIDYTNKQLYMNTGTLASPTWTLIVAGLAPVSTFAAAGSSQSDGVALAVNGGVAYVTGANATKGAVLPVAAAGMRIQVVNDSAANAVLKIYGNATDSATINGTAGSTAYSMAAKTTVTFIATATAKWQTSPLVAS